MSDLEGGTSLVELLLHGALAPIQLQVVTTETLSKPGHGLKGNILLPTLTWGETVQWSWPWKAKALRCW